MSLMPIIRQLVNIGLSEAPTLPLFSGYLTLDNQGHPTHVISSFQHKHSYYYGGKTYFLWMATDGLKDINYLFSFNHATKYISNSYNTLSTNPNANDLHSHGSLFITASGTIIVATSSRIGSTDQGIIISRSTVNDISSWTPISEIDDDTNYCQISQIASGRVFLWYRQNHYNARIMYSDDDGATWSTPVTFFSFNNGVYEWMYPYGIHNNGGNKLYLTIMRRQYLNYPTAYVAFPERYYFETTDGDTFTNISGSFAKKVSTGGYITKAEADANFLIEQAIDQNEIVWNEGGIIGIDGIPYLLSRKEGGGVNFTFWNGSSWTIREVTTVNTFISLNTRKGIYQIDANTFKIWILETISGLNQLTTYTTTDKGLTWSYGGQLTDTYTHYSRADVTDNIQTSGKGLLATIKGDGTGANSEIFIQEL